MKFIFFTLLIISFIAGCGYNPDEPVYDISNNPEEFPEGALNLLISIDDGRLIGLDAITNNFGELYANNPELLDKISWKEVVSRLGSKFRYIADTLAGQGMAGYSLAGDYYQLSSYANPSDQRLCNEQKLCFAGRKLSKAPILI